jgi:hypothetical protein
MGRPSQNAFGDKIRSGKLLNNSITVQDSRNSIQIYGVDLGVLKGKTTKNKTGHISFDIMERPKPMNIILSIDVMYFTGLTFLTAVSRNIRFITATHEINDVEFEEDGDVMPIHTAMADNEFQALKEDLEHIGMNVHVVSKNEHAPEVERQNRVIKERARVIIQTMPYKKIPKKMRMRWYNTRYSGWIIYQKKDRHNHQRKLLWENKNLC